MWARLLRYGVQFILYNQIHYELAPCSYHDGYAFVSAHGGSSPAVMCNIREFGTIPPAREVVAAVMLAVKRTCGPTRQPEVNQQSTRSRSSFSGTILLPQMTRSKNNPSYQRHTCQPSEEPKKKKIKKGVVRRFVAASLMFLLWELRVVQIDQSMMRDDVYRSVS